MKDLKGPFGVVIAGVGGQGALTIAQLVLGAAWKSGYHVLQSEVHGMSQRGGAVNAHVVFDTKEVTGPILMEGTGDVLLGIEPLECLRYLSLLKKDAAIVVSKEPVKTIPNYPNEDELFGELNKIKNISIVDTKEHAKTLNHRHAGNVILLGMASKYMPIDLEIWKNVISERFQAKGEKIIEKNIEAFEFGRNL